MSDTVFRNAETIPEPQPVPAIKEPEITTTDHTQVPYFDYEHSTGHSLTVDYFNLGDNYEVFSEELNSINEYINQKVSSGEVANSQQAVKDLLATMEKTNNLKHEERAVVKVGVLSAYAKFLLDSEKVKKNVFKYGITR